MDVTIEGKTFTSLISERELQAITARLATKLTADYDGKNPVFLVVLQGASIFSADLVRHLPPDMLFNMSFISAASYDGMRSTGTVNIAVDGKVDLAGRHVVIIEDIVDTGLTLERIKDYLERELVESIATCALLFKPGKYEGDGPIEYIGKEIDDDFVIGYGLDLNGQGRNLRDIHVLKSH